LAAPFVQGRLIGKEVEVEIDTSCAQSGQALRLVVDQRVCTSVEPPGVEPLVFEPSIDWTRFTKPHIIDDF